MQKKLPVLFAILLSGCSSAPEEPMVKGKPLSHWVKQARERQDTGGIDFHHGKSWQLQEEGFKALVQIGEPAVAPLIEMLHHDKWNVRWMAAKSLGEIRPPAKQAFEPLAETLKSESDVTRREVADALLIIDRSRAVPLVAEALKDPAERPMSRALLAFKLGQLGADAKAAVPALRQALEDDDKEVREAAVAALKRIDPTADVKSGKRQPGDRVR